MGIKRQDETLRMRGMNLHLCILGMLEETYIFSWSIYCVGTVQKWLCKAFKKYLHDLFLQKNEKNHDYICFET